MALRGTEKSSSFPFPTYKQIIKSQIGETQRREQEKGQRNRVKKKRALSKLKVAKLGYYISRSVYQLSCPGSTRFIRE